MNVTKPFNWVLLVLATGVSGYSEFSKKNEAAGIETAGGDKSGSVVTAVGLMVFRRLARGNRLADIWNIRFAMFMKLVIDRLKTAEANILYCTLLICGFLRHCSKFFVHQLSLITLICQDLNKKENLLTAAGRFTHNDFSAFAFPFPVDSCSPDVSVGLMSCAR